MSQQNRQSSSQQHPPQSSPRTKKNLTRRQFGRWMLGSGFFGVLGLGNSYLETQRLNVSHYNKHLRGLMAPLKVVFISDLHYGTWVQPHQIRTWFKQVQAQHPDVILIGGDLIDSRASALTSEFLECFRLLQAPLGTFSVWGNHDYGFFRGTGSRNQRPQQSHHDWITRREHSRQAFAKVGLRLLRNQGLAIRSDVWLGGLDDYWQGISDSSATGQGAQSAQTKILMCHNPDAILALKTRWDLALCGHTHGGQIRLPWLGALLVPSAYGQTYAMGWFHTKQAQMYVSRGLGVSGLPLRHMCMPEIVVLHLSPL